MALRALALNCTLKTGAGASSTDLLLREVLAELSNHDVKADAPVRVADYNVKPGVTSDEGPGDDWPELRHRAKRSSATLRRRAEREGTR